jgi:hypothetical protein
MVNMKASLAAQTKIADEPIVSPNRYTVRKLPNEASVFELVVTAGPFQGSRAIVEAISPSLAYFNVLDR